MTKKVRTTVPSITVRTSLYCTKIDTKYEVAFILAEAKE